MPIKKRRTKPAPEPEPVEETVEELATEPEPVEDLATESKAVYRVKPGKSISTLVGVIPEGGEVKPEYLVGGQDTFDQLVKSKMIV